jgi:hypothetical protein
MHHAHAHRARFGARSLLLFSLLLSAAPIFAAAPRITGTPTTTATVGVLWSFQPKATDADGNKLTFSAVNKPPFTYISPTTGRIYGTAYAEQAKTYSNIVISVTDGTTKVSLPAFSLVVKPNPNKSPTISGTPPSTATVGVLYSFQPTAKDPEGKTLTFSIKNKPSWATFSSTTGKLSGTPTAAGKFGSIKIIVSDGVSSASLTYFTITVSGGSTTNTPPVISGTPSTSVGVGKAYSFQPSASDANHDPLTFSITNKPSWATFSASTGKLSGTPATTGSTSNIVIKVSDGKVTASLAAFGISVVSGTPSTTGSVTLNWTPPTRNTDGSTLTNLAGYKVVYGKSAGSLTSVAQISNPGISSYVIDGLASGTWYFSVKSYTSNGSESAGSNTVSMTVQ